MLDNPWKKRRDLLMEAKAIMSEMEEKYEHFNFSKGWFERFKKRHKIGKLSSFSKKMVANPFAVKVENGDKDLKCGICVGDKGLDLKL